MESCCFTILGNLVMKSILTTSYFHSSICNGCNSPARFLCSAFTLLAFKTPSYKLCYVFLHSWPKILFLYCCNGFLASWMTCIRDTVHFMLYNIPRFIILRYVDLIFIHEEPMFIHFIIHIFRLHIALLQNFFDLQIIAV